LLRFRARSEEELVARLRAREYPAAVVTQVMQELKRAGIVDDRQFALVWARSRASSLHGSRRIAQELLRRGVSRDIVQATVAQVGRDYDERDAAKAFLARRVRRYQRFSRQVQWRRLSAQLARRGFSGDVIEDALTTCVGRKPF